MKIFTLLITIFYISPFQLKASTIPHDIIDVKKLIPEIKLDIRYFSSRNFIGKNIDGYEASKCYLQKSSAESLKRVQEGLKEFKKLEVRT